MHDPDDESTKGVMDVSVAKNRNGPSGDIKLHFLKDSMTVVSL